MIQTNDALGGQPARDFASATARPDFSPNSGLPRHRWYRFKEGFSAGLVEAFAANYLPSTGGYLLDPFVGSGTTALEGARLGHQVDGLETNPFMAFLATVKTREYSAGLEIEATAMECLRQKARSAAFALPNDSTLVERKGLDKWLLNRTVATRFEQLRTAIASVGSQFLRDLLLLALLSSIEDVANARKDGKCWRYKSKWRAREFDAKSLDEAFATQVMRFADDIALCPHLRGHATIVEGDAREHLARVGAGGRSYDGVLTSPPYLNSFDYTDIYRPELLLLNMARNSTDLRRMRLNTLRSHVQVAWKSSAPLDIPILHEKIQAIDRAGSWCGRIPDMINAYFVDLDCVIEQCAQRLKPGATAGFVVADSAYCGVVIPVDLILSEIFERRGFAMKKITLFRQTRGNGNHQVRSTEYLKEVMVVAEYRGTVKRQALRKSA